VIEIVEVRYPYNTHRQANERSAAAYIARLGMYIAAISLSLSSGVARVAASPSPHQNQRQLLGL